MENINICIIEDFDAYILEQGDVNVYIKEEEEFESSINLLNSATLVTEESTNSIILDNILKELDKKQDKEDEGLDTNNKTVVGAINELRDIIIATGGNTEATKEVVEVESEEALYALENPSKEVIYITADTGMLYIYDGNSFTNVTNQEVDNTIYVTNINELLDREYTKAGIFTVVCVISRIGFSRSLIYSLNVSVQITLSETIYTLKLANNDGWAEVATNEDGEKYWKWHNYTYQEDIDALLPLIYAGL